MVYFTPWQISPAHHRVANNMAHKAVALKEEGNKWTSFVYNTALRWLVTGTSKMANTLKQRVSILKRTAHDSVLPFHCRWFACVQNTERLVEPQTLHQPCHDPHQAPAVRGMHGWLPKVDRAGPWQHERILPPCASPTRPQSSQWSPLLRSDRLWKVPRDER